MIKMNKKNWLYLLSVALFICWMTGFFFLGAGMMIHSLVVMSLVVYMQAVIITPKTRPHAQTAN